MRQTLVLDSTAFHVPSRKTARRLRWLAIAGSTIVTPGKCEDVSARLDIHRNRGCAHRADAGNTRPQSGAVAECCLQCAHVTRIRWMHSGASSRSPLVSLSPMCLQCSVWRHVCQKEEVL